MKTQDPHILVPEFRPFPLEEAEVRFDELRSRGFSSVRLALAWESLEPTGPGIYDESYLAYLRKLLILAEKKGTLVFMEPRQNRWSRWTGGDGAPAWTLEKLGMEPGGFDENGTAAARRQYAVFTLFTLFFAGAAYAPEVKIEGESVQDWFQERYIAAFRHCYRRLKNCKALAGWGAMNGYQPGLIGHKDLGDPENIPGASGLMLSPFGAMAAASEQKGRPLFKEGYTCPWKQAGIWTDENHPQLLRKDHFALFKGKPADFAEDFLKPFIVKFVERMKEADRPCLFFNEGFEGEVEISACPEAPKG